MEWQCVSVTEKSPDECETGSSNSSSSNGGEQNGAAEDFNSLNQIINNLSYGTNFGTNGSNGIRANNTNSGTDWTEDQWAAWSTQGNGNVTTPASSNSAQWKQQGQEFDHSKIYTATIKSMLELGGAF